MDSLVCPFGQYPEINEKLFLGRILVGAPSIPHIKGLVNLKYEIRVCPKIHNKVAIKLRTINK